MTFDVTSTISTWKKVIINSHFAHDTKTLSLLMHKINFWSGILLHFQLSKTFSFSLNRTSSQSNKKFSIYTCSTRWSPQQQARAKEETKFQFSFKLPSIPTVQSLQLFQFVYMDGLTFRFKWQINEPFPSQNIPATAKTTTIEFK